MGLGVLLPWSADDGYSIAGVDLGRGQLSLLGVIFVALLLWMAWGLEQPGAALSLAVISIALVVVVVGIVSLADIEGARTPEDSSAPPVDPGGGLYLVTMSAVVNVLAGFALMRRSRHSSDDDETSHEDRDAWA